MDKTLLIKSVFVGGGITGVGCAVGIPLASTRANSSTIASASHNGGGSENCKLGASESLKGRTVDFGGLWQHIKNKLNKNNECEDFPGKEKLKSIMNTISTEGGKIQDESFDNCSEGPSCGFLSLKTKDTKNKVKVRITKDNSSNRWQVIVVKQGQNTKPDYYDGYPENVNAAVGKEMSNIAGDDLTLDWRQDSKWSEISGLSIKYPDT